MKDWRIARLSQVRKLIMSVDPDITEEVKWKKASNPDGIPVWYKNGMICTGETYKDHLRLTFAKGGKISDPKKLFNSSRAIVINENDKIDESAFKDIIREAIKLNVK